MTVLYIPLFRFDFVVFKSSLNIADVKGMELDMDVFELKNLNENGIHSIKVVLFITIDDDQYNETSNFYGTTKEISQKVTNWANELVAEYVLGYLL